MSNKYLIDLCDSAELGKKFEDFEKHECTLALISRLEERAKEATEQCTRLSPVTAQAEIIEEQIRVRIYRGIIQEIQGFISEGKNATHRLTATDAAGED